MTMDNFMFINQRKELRTIKQVDLYKFILFHILMMMLDGLKLLINTLMGAGRIFKTLLSE